MIETIERAIEKCASRVAAQCPALDAMQFAQAAESGEHISHSEIGGY